MYFGWRCVSVDHTFSIRYQRWSKSSVIPYSFQLTSHAEMKWQTLFWKNKNILNILPSRMICFRLNFCESTCLYGICESERMEAARIHRRMYEYTSKSFTATFHRMGLGSLIASVSVETYLLHKPTLFLADMSSLYRGNSAGRYISSSGLSIGDISHALSSL
jgi:hypothetical protein